MHVPQPFEFRASQMLRFIKKEQNGRTLAGIGDFQ